MSRRAQSKIKIYLKKGVVVVVVVVAVVVVVVAIRKKIKKNKKNSTEIKTHAARGLPSLLLQGSPE